MLSLLSGPTGTFFAVLQVLIGIALLCVALPLAWRFVRAHMLWSLRNKLVLTYLLIGLAPVVMLLTLAAVFAYVATGQFAIHLADSRLLAELSQMSTENEHRADLISPRLEHQTIQSAESLEAEIASTRETERSTNLDMPRMKLHRETRAFLNGAPIALDPVSGRSATRGKTPWGLPPWAIELPGGNFSGMILDGKDPYLVVIKQQRWKDGRIFTLMTSLAVDSSLLNMIAGVIRPDAGAIRMDGENVTRLPNHLRVRKRINQTFQLVRMPGQSVGDPDRDGGRALWLRRAGALQGRQL